MLDDHAASVERHERFVRRVLDGGEVRWLFDGERNVHLIGLEVEPAALAGELRAARA